MGSTHFTDPILYLGKPLTTKKWFENLPMGQNPDYITFMDDFTGIALDATNDWTVVKDSGAAVGILADTVPGWLSMSSAATTDTDGSSIQTNEIFVPAANRDIWFETRIQSEDTGGLVTAQAIMAGLTVNFSTNPEAALTAADRICFQVDDGSGVIQCKTEVGGVETSTSSQKSLVDATAIKLGFHVKGTSLVEFFVDRVLVASHTAGITAENMTPAIMQFSGSASNTHLIYVDYVFCAMTR